MAHRVVGASGVFDPVVDGRCYTFAFDGERITDHETSSAWDVAGHGVSGPLAGRRLERVLHADHFWFSWAAFMPQTVVYRGAAR